jgi:hypothetical protein
MKIRTVNDKIAIMMPSTISISNAAAASFQPNAMIQNTNSNNNNNIYSPL